jgi:hypothetical protein
VTFPKASIPVTTTLSSMKPHAVLYQVQVAVKKKTPSQ